jgi:hypothetical protein
MLWILVLFSCLQAQEIKISWKEKNKTWEFQGACDFPNNTVLILRMHFQNLRLWEKQTLVQENKFECIYLPPPHYPLGKYNLQVCYAPQLQFDSIQKILSHIPEFYYNYEFFYGSAHEERVQIQQEARFCLDMIAEIEHWFVTFCKQALDKNKFTPSEWIQWLKESNRTLEFFRSQIQEKKSNALFRFLPAANHLAKAVKQLQTLHDKAMQKTNLKVNPKIDAEEFEKEIQLCEKEIREIEIREILNHARKNLPLAQNIGWEDVKTDMEWVEKIFKDMRKGYKNAQESPQSWSNVFYFCEQEIEDFTLKATEYKQSPFAQSDIPTNMEALSKGLKDLLFSHAFSLVEKHPSAGLPIPKTKIKTSASEIILNLQKNFGALEDLVELKESQEQEEIQKAREFLKKNVAQLAVCYEKSKEGQQIKDLKFFDEWLKKWEEQVNALQISPEVASRIPPEVQKKFSRFFDFVKSKPMMHKKILTGEAKITEEQFALWIRQQELEFQLLLKKLEKASEF